jgi:DNA-binding SARP family transcriptional activator
VRVYTFGLLHIEWVDQQRGCATAIPEEQLCIKDGTAALWLLKLLLSQPHRFALRDEIMEHLWPEVSSTAAAKRLDNVVYALRKLLRPPGSTQALLLRQATPANGNGYQLAAYPHIWVDADAFAWLIEQAARMERFGEESLSLWEAAYALAARGTYLVEERYSEWAMQRRASLEGQHRQCVHRLAALYRQQGHRSLAELRLRTYWQTHPTDEDALRPLLELLGEQERYQEAEACYQQALEALQEEGRDPDARTQYIAEYLRAKQIRRQRARGNGGALEQAAIIRQEPSLPATSFVLAESGVLVPAHLVLDTSPIRVELFDWPSWFSEQVDELKGVLAGWQEQHLACSHVQALLHVQMERWNTMSDQAGEKSSDVLLGRRMALTTLATVSAALLTKVQTGLLTTLLLEEFLAQCTASITACWHLLNGDGLGTVEHALPKYLPLLVALARQSSPYQQTAAYLAGQGSLLMSLVSYHRLRFRPSLAYANQAVALAKLSGDHNLHVCALVLLGDVFECIGQPETMLQKHQEVAQYLDGVVVLPLRSLALAELAYAYARNGQGQEALQCMDQARNGLLDEYEEIPCFVSSDYGPFQLILFEGRTHLALGESDAEHVQHHSQQARTALAQLEKLSSTIIVPERSKLEIINYQATAAIGAGNMEEFEHYLLAGAEGAKALGSEKRRQEVIANWKMARQAWPHEQRVMKLVDVFVEG